MFTIDFNTVKIANHIENTENEWEILITIPFDSDRKRMSVVVKEKETNKIFLFAKGSDGIMLNGVLPHPPVVTRFENKTERSDVNRILESFSKEGLRILVMGYKEIEEKYFAEWNAKHDLDLRFPQEGIYDLMEFLNLPLGLPAA